MYTSAPTTSQYPADKKNGESLLVLRDRRVAVPYTVEALRIFDHYHFLVTQEEAKKAKTLSKRSDTGLQYSYR